MTTRDVDNLLAAYDQTSLGLSAATSAGRNPVVEAGAEMTGGADTYFEDFSVGLRELVAAQRAEGGGAGMWFGGAGGNPVGLIMGIDWMADFAAGGAGPGPEPEPEPEPATSALADALAQPAPAKPTGTPQPAEPPSVLASAVVEAAAPGSAVEAAGAGVGAAAGGKADREDNALAMAIEGGAEDEAEGVECCEFSLDGWVVCGSN